MARSKAKKERKKIDKNEKPFDVKSVKEMADSEYKKRRR